MSKTISTLQKVTERGQITLPISWRKNMKSNFVSVASTPHGLLISVPKINTDKEYTVFDAIRDNGGKGIKAKDFLKALEKSLN